MKRSHKSVQVRAIASLNEGLTECLHPLSERWDLENQWYKANTVRNKLLLPLTLSPILPVMVMLQAIIFNHLSQKSIQWRKFRGSTGRESFLSLIVALSGFPHPAVAAWKWWTSVWPSRVISNKASRQKTASKELLGVRCCLLGVTILSSSGPTFPMCTAAPLLWWLPRRHCSSPGRVQGTNGEGGSAPPTPHLSPASSTSGSAGTV